MAARTLAERLESVQTAIEDLEGGAQRVDHNGRSVTYADLATLYNQEKRILRQINRASSPRRTVSEM